MEYRKLGSTGIMVSAVGFGGIPVQRISSSEAKKVLIYAEDKGINFVDSARGYSVSEEFIGNALEGRRDKWIIATKSMSRDYESMIRDVNISLTNLKTSYIDLYQFHNIRTMDEYNKVMGQNGAYEALYEMKVKGIVKHIGLTSHSADILKMAIESGKFETIMFPYNIIERQGESVFKRAQELGIGVIAMKPLAGGALDDGELSMKFILSNKNITTAIPGMADTNEVDINAAAGCNIEPLTEEEKARMDKTARELGSEFCRRCGYCAPCTQGIDIPGIMVLKAYKERYNLGGWAEERYFANKKRAKDCTECGACEKRCPYELPIRKMMKNISKCFNE